MSRSAGLNSRKTSAKKLPAKLVDLYKTIVVIDTTEIEITRVGLIHQSQTYRLIKPVRAQQLVTMIEQILEERKLSFADIRALAVLTGPGSFTGVRIGITVANTLSWVKKLPIVEFPHVDFETAMKEINKKTTEDIVKQARAVYS